MSDKATSSGGGIGFCGMLTILFVGLKLTGYIDWSWWWVVSPLWITCALLLLLLFAGFTCAAVASFYEARKGRNGK